MKHTGIFQLAFRRLAGLYAVLAVVVTLSFTIPPIIAQQQAREHISDPERYPAFAQQIVGPGRGVVIIDDDTAITGRVKQFVSQRDDQFGRRLTTTILEINGAMLLVTIIASYFLARRSLQPLQEVLDQQETFAAELAHELKTPLATALLELEELKRSGKNLTTDQKKDLARITADIKGVGTLTEQTLSLMAVDYNESSQEFTDLDLNEVVEHARLAVCTQAKSKKIDLKINSLPDKKVAGNEIQLRQLFVALLDNAVKYTPNGGSVMVEGMMKGDRLIINVSDTGVGIPSELHDKIFAKFYQGDNGVSGSGLGLAIARRICDVHGGTIAVQSTPNKGAVFTVTLPLLERS